MQLLHNLLVTVLRKCAYIASFILSIPICSFIICIYPFFRIKFISLYSDRIGHYAANTELLLCYLKNIQCNEKKTKYFFYIREAQICNKQLHKMWKRIIPIIPFIRLAEQIDKNLFCFFGSKYKNAALKHFEEPQGNRDLHGSFKKYKPFLYFTMKEHICGESILRNLGISKNKKYVCLLIRDSEYLNQFFKGQDWSYHSYRDCNIDNFRKTALFLVEKGYCVIRMGKAVSKAFDISHPSIIDYAMHPVRSDFADIYLSAHCEFFISTSSGLDAVAQIFRKPILLVNIAPFNNQLQFWYPCELFILKKIYDKTEKRMVSMSEFDRKILDLRDLQGKLTYFNWEVMENSEDEILDAVQEMEKSIDSKLLSVLLNPWHSLLKKPIIFSMIPDREFLKGYPENFYARMGDKFWNENAEHICH